MIKRLKRAVFLLTLSALTLSIWSTWAGLTDREMPWPVSSLTGAGHVEGTDPDFDDLRVVRDEFGTFDGTISVENPSGAYQDVFVTVDLFDGDQNVGELSGIVTLKPRSVSSVDLVSTDRHVHWDDAYVDLTRSSG